MMDYLSRSCLTFLIFIETLVVLKHLTFNYYVYLMRMTLNLAGREMLSCMVVISVFITAYASFQYLTLGPYLHLFRDMSSAVLTSIRIATAYVKMKIYFETNFSDTDINKLMFVCYFFIVTLTLMNIFISIINNAMETITDGNVSQSIKREMYDSNLNDFFWKTISRMFSNVEENSSKYINRPDSLRREYIITILLIY